LTAFQKMIYGLQEFSLLIKDIFVHLGSVRDNWSETVQEMYLIGTKSFFLILLGGYLQALYSPSRLVIN